MAPLSCYTNCEDYQHASSLTNKGEDSAYQTKMLSLTKRGDEITKLLFTLNAAVPFRVCGRYDR